MMTRNSSLSDMDDSDSELLDSTFSRELDNFVQKSLKRMYDNRCDRVDDQIQTVTTTLEGIHLNVKRMHHEVKSKVQKYGEFAIKNFQNINEQIYFNKIKRNMPTSSNVKSRQYQTHAKASVRKSESMGDVFYRVSLPEGLIYKPFTVHQQRTRSQSRQSNYDQPMLDSDLEESEYRHKSSHKSNGNSRKRLDTGTMKESVYKTKNDSLTNEKPEPERRSTSRPKPQKTEKLKPEPSKPQIYTSTITIPISNPDAEPNSSEQKPKPEPEKKASKTYKSTATIPVTKAEEPSKPKTYKSTATIPATKNEEPSKSKTYKSTATIPVTKNEEPSKPKTYKSTATIPVTKTEEPKTHTSTATIPVSKPPETSKTSRRDSSLSEPRHTSRATIVLAEPAKKSTPPEPKKSEQKPQTSTANIAASDTSKTPNRSPQRSSKTSQPAPGPSTDSGRPSDSNPKTYKSEKTITLSTNKSKPRTRIPPRETGGTDTNCCFRKLPNRISKEYKDTRSLNLCNVQKIVSSDYIDIMSKFPPSCKLSYKNR